MTRVPIICLLVLATAVATSTGAAATGEDRALERERSELVEQSRLLEHPEPAAGLRAVKWIAASIDWAREPALVLAILERAAEGTGPAAAQARAALARHAARADGERPESTSSGWAAGATSLRQQETVAELAARLGGPRHDRLRAVKSVAARLDSAAETAPLLALLRSAVSDPDLEVSRQATHALARHADRLADDPIADASSLRASAERALGWEREAVAESEKALAGRNRSARLAAVSALSRLLESAQDRQAVARLLAEAAGDADRAVADQAAHALARSWQRELIP